MNRDELLDKLAMELAEWPKDRLTMQYVLNEKQGCSIYRSEWLHRRTELINCPPDSEAPEWAKWKAQDADGSWNWFEIKPSGCDSNLWMIEGEGEAGPANKGCTPNGHRWQDTLTEVNTMTTTAHEDQYTSSPEEDAEFARIQARQDSERPHEADARMLDAQLAADVAKHYKHSYKGIKLDPYRIAKVYAMEGGPREQIMKKCLRFTDKGQTEQQVVNEIRSALNRWQAMIDEDSVE